MDGNALESESKQMAKQSTGMRSKTIMQSRTLRIDKNKMNFEPIDLNRIDADDWLWEDSDFELDEADENDNTT